MRPHYAVVERIVTSSRQNTMRHHAADTRAVASIDSSQSQQQGSLRESAPHWKGVAAPAPNRGSTAAPGGLVYGPRDVGNISPRSSSNFNGTAARIARPMKTSHLQRIILHGRKLKTVVAMPPPLQSCKYAKTGAVPTARFLQVRGAAKAREGSRPSEPKRPLRAAVRAPHIAPLYPSSCRLRPFRAPVAPMRPGRCLMGGRGAQFSE